MVGDFPFMLSLVEAFLGVFQQHQLSCLTPDPEVMNLMRATSGA
jgi:hypothetical protein